MTSHYFIGIPLSKQYQSALAQWQEQMKQQLPYKQWPFPEDFHITLKFLGAVEDEQYQLLKENFQGWQPETSFDVSIGGLNSFGNPKTPRVVYAEVEKHAELAALQHQAAAVAREAGFPYEKRGYNPHITLAKKWNGKAPISGLPEQERLPGKLKIETVHLYKIHPSKRPKYEPVLSKQLERLENESGTAD